MCTKFCKIFFITKWTAILVAIVVLSDVKISFAHVLDLDKNCKGNNLVNYICRNLDLSAYQNEPINIKAVNYISTLTFRNCSLPHPPNIASLYHLSVLSIIDSEMKYIRELKLSNENTRNLGINFSGNLITHVNDTNFQAVKNLGNINLSQNNISKITNAFKNNLNLQVIDLHSNLITDLPETVFSELIKLNRLDLSYNKISKLEPKIFNGLFKLENLDLSHNQLDLPEFVFPTLNQLGRLDLSYNKISKLEPKIFHGLFKLENLDLSHNQLEEIPANLFNSTKTLKNLNLQQNKIKSLTGNIFSGLSALTVLHLADNEISIFNIDILKELVLLKALHLQENEIRSFVSDDDEELAPILLPNLELLDISKNPKIKKHPKECSAIKMMNFELPNLTSFNLSSTNLCKIKYNFFPELRKLDILDLSHNYLVEIHWNVFLLTDSLKKIFLNGNRLTSLEYDKMNQILKKYSIQLQDNQWSCTYLENMILSFMKNDIDYLPPADYISKSKSNIAKIECSDY